MKQNPILFQKGLSLAAFLFASGIIRREPRLLAITLLLLFATVWVGLFLSRRFTEPLLAVTEATQRVAEGDALEEVEMEVPATDEVAILVDSFNAMVRRVRATEAEILASNQELTALLATVPTGVLWVSADGVRFRPNPAAATLLGRPEWAHQWLDMSELDQPGLTRLYHQLTSAAPTWPAPKTAMLKSLASTGS